MSDHHTQDWDNAHALSGAYAVDALDGVERARFEEHLETCPDCQVEVETFRETAAALAVDPVEPPARLRAEVLAGIESIRPLPPLVGQDREPAVDREQAHQTEPPARRPWYATTGPLLVAAALVLIALVTTVALRPWASDEDDPLTATERVLADPDRQEVTAQFPDGSMATVVVSRDEGRAVIVTEDMALAPEGKVYELWLQGPDGPMEPAGLMPDDSDATVLLEGDASDAVAVGITVEPDGGSEEPSEDPDDLVHVFEITA
jgi:anti-sigma-K factor RskA